MHLPFSLSSAYNTLRLAMIPVVIVGVTATLGFTFHVRGERIMEHELRERMLSTVGIAARYIDADLVEQVDGPEDAASAAFASLVTELKKLRSLSPHMRFAYIMRKTDDPAFLAFIADADGLSTPQELDVNGNGAVDHDEVPGMPGKLYPIEGLGTAAGEAFLMPVVDHELTVDQWGTFISAYAPIQNKKGKVVAILGMDMTADEFFSLSQNTFSLLGVLLAILMGALLAAYIFLIIRSRSLASFRQLEDERTALLDLAMHQLGMPLATFKWWLEILKEGDVQKSNGQIKQEEVYDQLQQGIDRMDMIVRALNEARHLQSENTDTEVACTAVVPVINTTVEDVLQVTRNKNQKIDVHIDTHVSTVALDAKLLSGVIRELLENASSYSPEQSTISLRARKIHHAVEIIVQDHGCGIPAADIPQLFKQFRRASNASHFKPTGNGLGLYIVKRIIERVNGRITLQSKEGEGTMITILLPTAA